MKIQLTIAVNRWTVDRYTVEASSLPKTPQEAALLLDRQHGVKIDPRTVLQIEQA